MCVLHHPENATRTSLKQQTRHFHGSGSLTPFVQTPTETGGEVPSEPQRADSLRVSRLGGPGVQPAPARA